MPVGTPNSQLQNFLDSLASQLGGSSNPYYQDVFNAIVNSPDLLGQFNSAAANEQLAGTNKIDLPQSLLDSMIKNNYSQDQINNAFTGTLGHEVYHAANSGSVTGQQNLMNANLGDLVKFRKTEVHR